MVYSGQQGIVGDLKGFMVSSGSCCPIVFYLAMNHVPLPFTIFVPVDG